MRALQSLNYHATSVKLAKHIAACNDKREEDIRDTVKRVLSDAVANGFLITRGKSYQLPAPSFTVQTDSRKRSMPRRNAAGKIRKLNSAKAIKSKQQKTRARKSASAKKN